MEKEFEPEETVPIRRPGVRPWVFAAFAAVVVGGAAGLIALLESGERPRREQVPPSPPPAPAVAAKQPEPVPEVLSYSPYAMELAAMHTHPFGPTQEMMREFDALLQTARREYTRSTDMQIRDAVLSVASLKAYNRPDLTLLKAFRMIVDWAPEGSAGRSVENLPVSRAVDDITGQIVGAYNDWVAAQWQARYEQQQAEYERRLAVAEQRAAIRAAQEQARLEAEAARAREIMNFQEALRRNSIFGQFWRR